MGEHGRILATRVIEEIDNQLRRLTQAKDDTTSSLVQQELDESIHRRLRERIAWERLLAQDDSSDHRPGPAAMAAEQQKLAS